ncbi:extracellular solute-binding protein [Granulosicoccus antarcticus]|uniref:Iron uptake protein A1 n=1 Tax=Granulosicoccus antarcticus IMCC3135 TaxID=1192854 RepID=A0A2Z2NM46_9GAMM|nr:extracellular solute-binding protein [Granulosicoccus antarcticus]ASJ72512.1 Iron uptake protein A1 [Granulosicoccus antarcticus IMCC3135]
MKLPVFRLLATTSLVMAIFAPTAATAAEEVNVYSHRQPFLTEPVFDEFTRETGIKVNTVFAKEGLIERLMNEGINSPADLMLVANVGSLGAAVESDIAQRLDSDVIEANIPENFRDKGNKWFGLTSRARIIITSKDRVEPGLVETYADLTKPELKGRICTRSGKHPYMVELVASMIAHDGKSSARNWLAGVKDNLASKPQGGDRTQVNAIAEGACDVAIVNSYYMGGMLSDPKEKAAAETVNIIFPDQNGKGTHMNISGVILTKASPNRENAVKLIEFLSEDVAQSMYANLNQEYPINPAVKPSDLIASWGEFKHDELSLNAIVKNRALAYRLADEVDYDG